VVLLALLLHGPRVAVIAMLEAVVGLHPGQAAAVAAEVDLETTTMAVAAMVDNLVAMVVKHRVELHHGSRTATSNRATADTMVADTAEEDMEVEDTVATAVNPTIRVVLQLPGSLSLPGMVTPAAHRLHHRVVTTHLHHP